MECRATEATMSRPFQTRLLSALVAGLGSLVAVALFLGVFDGELPKPARAEVATPVLAAASGPARPAASGLCFHGPGSEFLDVAPAGQGCR